MQYILVAVIASAVVVAMLSAFGIPAALAAPPNTTPPPPNTTPSGQVTGQPGAPTNTCPGTGGTPGQSGSASNPGSPFNSNPSSPGQAGNVYAGNPNTASLAHSNSGASIAQYDTACFH